MRVINYGKDIKNSVRPIVNTTSNIELAFITNTLTMFYSKALANTVVSRMKRLKSDIIVLDKSDIISVIRDHSGYIQILINNRSVARMLALKEDTNGEEV